MHLETEKAYSFHFTVYLYLYRAIVVCAWGDKGAVAADSSGQVHHSPAFPPPSLIDTLGAGDTFNAGVMHRLSQGATISDAISFACRLAGAKCGMHGFDDLNSLAWLSVMKLVL